MERRIISSRILSKEVYNRIFSTLSSLENSSHLKGNINDHIRPDLYKLGYIDYETESIEKIVNLMIQQNVNSSNCRYGKEENYFVIDYDFHPKYTYTELVKVLNSWLCNSADTPEWKELLIYKQVEDFVKALCAAIVIHSDEYETAEWV